MKRARVLSFLVVLAAIVSLGMVGNTWADPTGDIQGANQMALEYFDLGEYKTSLKELQKNHAKLRKQGLSGQTIEADTLILMGMVQARGLGDDTKASELFKKALQVDRDAKLPSNADSMSKELFQNAKNNLYPTVDCTTLLGMSHNQTTQGQEGMPVAVEVKADKALQDKTELKLMYRGGGKGAYKETDFTKGKDCNYTAEIPGDVVTPPSVEYYVEAKLKDGRLGAKKGGVKTPYSVNVIFGAAQTEPEEEPEPDMASITRSEEENPDVLAGRPKGPRGSGCAGCSFGATGSNAPVGMIVLFLGVALAFRRRRV